jgi:hypothetical protein
MGWAVLALGQLTACGGGGSGGGLTDGGPRHIVGDDEDDEEIPVEEDSGPASKPDAGGSPEAAVDAGSGSDADANVDVPDTGCVPKGCLELGVECGAATDGCGGTIEDCGKCKAPETCGAVTPNMCDCQAKTCDQLSAERSVKVCGAVQDGCGVTIQCGDDSVCGANKTCGGGGGANQCGCTANPNPCADKECGSASDGCGATVQCGTTCSANRTCDSQQICACKTVDATFCTGKCGPQQTPDGCTIDCGACLATCAVGAGVPCGGTGAAACICPAGAAAGTQDDEVCLNGQCCVPQSILETCGTAQCGSKTNNCGQIIQCGGCTGGNVCTQEQCISPQKAALLGDYALRNEAWVVVSGFSTRNESISYVNVRLNAQGNLSFTETSCGNRAFLGGAKTSAADVGPDKATKLESITSLLQVPGTVAGLVGPSEWIREAAPAATNTLGWRRKRPTYCPVPAVGGTPTPADSSAPGYALDPAIDVISTRAKKPWLGGTDCLCPEQELAKRGTCTTGTAAEQAACKLKWCQTGTPEERATCVTDWADNKLPFGVAKTVPDSDVTDCRVVDDDKDQKPALSVSAKADVLGIVFEAEVRTATITAVRYWGGIDLTPAKRHFGVSLDQADSTGTNVACQGAEILCSASPGQFCPAIISGRRSNPVDFVPVNPATLKSTGNDEAHDGPCFRIWADKANLFGHIYSTFDDEPIVQPTKSTCKAYPPGPVSTPAP